ncbi:LuxR C-terminal-related transcriptional regulator [Streptomyces fulvoviolaceus]|uniref:LuxR C-terminal-related transcriptional regulator n=1 Tax=Streptomyces fulvoviolaceus TaxID=285535 RepID=UPI00069418C3|nr:response regulator transcription factor [Streptomyces fulvoviolaceus]
MTAVLIANEQALQRVGLRMLLAAQPDLTVVGTAANAAEAVRLSAELRPDVVLLDSRVGGAAGLDAIRRIARPDDFAREQDAHTPRVLLLTTTALDEYPYGALHAGASGFLPEDATPDELATAIHVVAAGDVVISSGLTRVLIDAVRTRRPAERPGRRDRLSTLTERERDVLTAIAAGRSNAEIAEGLCIAPTTVKSHVSSILTKIGARGRVHAVVFAYESGLVRPPHHPTGVAVPTAAAA